MFKEHILLICKILSICIGVCKSARFSDHAVQELFASVKERHACGADAQDEYDAYQKPSEPVVQPGIIEANKLRRLPGQEGREHQDDGQI